MNYSETTHVLTDVRKDKGRSIFIFLFFFTVKVESEVLKDFGACPASFRSIGHIVNVCRYVLTCLVLYTLENISPFEICGTAHSWALLCLVLYLLLDPN